MFIKNLKLSVVAAMSIGILFTGCGENTDEAEAYNIEQWLDSGDNQKVIDALGDCSSYSGDSKIKCYTNVGAAYFGKAKFDMISLSKEFSNIDDNLPDSNKSKEFNKIIFNKLDDASLKTGITYYEKIVDNNSSVCTEKNYDNLNNDKKQACLSINPMLIANIVNDNTDTNKSEISVSIKQIIEFKEVLQNAVPELKSEDLVSILSGDTLSSDKDANGNNILDNVEATDITLKHANNGSASAYIIGTPQTNVYTHSKLTGVDYYKLDFDNNTSNDKEYYRLTQVFSGASRTILTTIPDIVCDTNNTTITGTINGTTILPCVKLKEDGNVTSLNDSVVNILNNDALLNAVALASDSEDNTKDDTTKINDFKNDICDTTGGNPNGCTLDGNGNVTNISQEALIDYMTENR